MVRGVVYTVRRTIQALDALAQGPVTTRSLADALLVVTRTSRLLLYQLMRDGLVARSPGRRGVFAATDDLRELGRRLALAPGLDRSDRQMGHSPDVPRLGIRIGDELLAAARAEAKRQGEPLSAFVRQALAYYIGMLAGQRAASQEQDKPSDDETP